MTAEPETRTTARLLVRGFNRHIHDHGPDADYAGEVTERRDGHGFMVERGGVPYAVTVEQLPAMSTTAPKTPGQCWAALRESVTAAQASFKSLASTDEGARRDIDMSFVAAYEFVLDQMRKLEAGQ